MNPILRGIVIGLLIEGAVLVVILAIAGFFR